MRFITQALAPEGNLFVPLLDALKTEAVAAQLQAALLSWGQHKDQGLVSLRRRLLPQMFSDLLESTGLRIQQ